MKLPSQGQPQPAQIYPLLELPETLIQVPKPPPLLVPPPLIQGKIPTLGPKQTPAVIESAPMMKDLTSQLTGMVPIAVLKKKSTAPTVEDEFKEFMRQI